MMRLYIVMGTVAWAAFVAGFICAILFTVWANKLQ